VADVCIVARGGGSFEELMAFNQEPVVRAIQAMRLPVITALGHTSDRTLADLVADREARTPTAAAELVVPNKQDLKRQLQERSERLTRAALNLLLVPDHQVAARGRDLDRAARGLILRRSEQLANLERLLSLRDPKEVLRARLRSLREFEGRFGRAVEASRRRIRAENERLGPVRDGLLASVSRSLKDQQRGLENRGQRLQSLGPEATLNRGYSICVDRDGGAVLRDARDSHPGQAVRVLLSAGRLECTVEETQP
jgi:exodeoxyribonuclease VII large subunit